MTYTPPPAGDPNAQQPVPPAPGYTPPAAPQPDPEYQGYQQPTAAPGQPTAPGQPAWQQPGYGQQQPGQPAYGQPQPGYAAAPAAAAPLTQAEDVQWASFAHLGGIIGILPSLIIFLVFKDRGPVVRQEAKEALNWQITLLIVWVASGILYAIAAAIDTALIFAGVYFPIFTTIVTLLLVGIGIANLVFSILGFVKVRGGGAYRYPVAIRFIK